ncbi:hypothetical protein MMC07_003320 [Pseudocyphellaria aurata]|nr:hypothetical protein [Pseudocyphellaria aurata]
MSESALLIIIMVSIAMSCAIFYRIAVARWTRAVMRRVSNIKARAMAKQAETDRAAAAMEAGVPGEVLLEDAPPAPPAPAADNGLHPAPGPAPAP